MKNLEAKKYYNDYDWMKQKYIEEKISAQKIASLLNCGECTIYRHLKTLKIINLKFRYKKYLSNYKWLYKMYIIKKLTTYEIEKILKCNPVTIQYWLKKFNIPRNPTHARKGISRSWKGLTHKQRFGIEKAQEMRKLNRVKHLRENLSKEILENLSKGRLGAKNPCWRGGISFEPYSSEFNESLKRKIRKRDNFECQECHQKEKELGYILSIHHINFNKTDNNPSNLISLCKSCHAQTQFNRQQWTDYYQNKVNSLGDIND